MDKELVDQKIGDAGEVELKLVAGNLVLSGSLASDKVGFKGTLSLEQDIVKVAQLLADEIKQKIPGTLDDVALDLFMSAVKLLKQ